MANGKYTSTSLSSDLIYKFSQEIQFRAVYIVVKLIKKKHYLNTENCKNFEMKKVKDQSRFDSSPPTLRKSDENALEVQMHYHLKLVGDIEK